MPSYFDFFFEKNICSGLSSPSLLKLFSSSPQLLVLCPCYALGQVLFLWSFFLAPLLMWHAKHLAMYQARNWKSKKLSIDFTCLSAHLQSTPYRIHLHRVRIHWTTLNFPIIIFYRVTSLLRTISTFFELSKKLFASHFRGEIRTVKLEFCFQNPMN